MFYHSLEINPHRQRVNRRMNMGFRFLANMVDAAAVRLVSVGRSAAVTHLLSVANGHKDVA